MARGSKPGERRGGRQKGTPNKATIERQRAVEAAGIDPKTFLLNGMAFYQQQIAKEQEKSKPDADKIAASYAAGKEFAKDVAPYCHPRLAAIEHAGRIDSNVTVSDARDKLAHLIAGQAAAGDEPEPSRTTH